MKRVCAAFLLSVLVSACSTGGPGGPTAGPGATTAGQPTGAGPATSAGGGATGILEAAQAASAHACELLPADLVATLVPNAPPPQEELFPARCSVFGETAAIAYSLDVTPFTVPAGSEEIAGFAHKAYLEKLTAGNWTLWVPLTADAGSLFVEVNNQDGADHTEDVVALARAILAKLGG